MTLLYIKQIVQLVATSWLNDWFWDEPDVNASVAHIWRLTKLESSAGANDSSSCAPSLLNFPSSQVLSPSSSLPIRSLKGPNAARHLCWGLFGHEGNAVRLWPMRSERVRWESKSNTGNSFVKPPSWRFVMSTRRLYQDDFDSNKCCLNKADSLVAICKRVNK